MSSKSPNLKLSLPQCSNCERHWRPKQGVVATRALCPKCAKQRRAQATRRFALSSVPAGGLGGAYLLPFALRDS